MKVRKPCLIKKALRPFGINFLFFPIGRPPVRKPCLIKKALRLKLPEYEINFIFPERIVRKPCLIKKALRRPLKNTSTTQPPGRLWENLAWLRRHYDMRVDKRKCYSNMTILWENLAWLRRHYDWPLSCTDIPSKFPQWENLAWLRRHYDMM